MLVICHLITNEVLSELYSSSSSNSKCDISVVNSIRVLPAVEAHLAEVAARCAFPFC